MARLLYEALPALRKERGLSQNDLSERTVRLGDVGVGLGTIQSYEKLKSAGRVPELEILDALARALDVDPAEEFYEYPLAVARRKARPTATKRAKKAAQRLGETQGTSPRTRRARGDEGPSS